MKKNKLLTPIIALLLSTAICLAVSGCADNSSSGAGAPPSGSQAKPESIPLQGGLNPTAPIKEYDYNPLTGAEIAEGYVIGTRPVAVMINNAPAAMPQRGIASAEVLYEMVTEGGITRLMAVFSDYSKMPQIGPVRSARDQHLQLALPMNAVFVHIGSSTYAANLLSQLAYQDIDGMYLGSQCFSFDNSRSLAGKGNEHCWFTDATLIGEGMLKNSIAPTGSYESLFQFADKSGSPRVPSEGDAPHVKVVFSGGSEVELVYSAESNIYLKTAYGQPQIDENTGEQISFTNAFVLFSNITLKPDGLCTEFDFTQGTGYYISQGKYEKVTWVKGDPTVPLKIYGADDKEISVNIGKSYVAFAGVQQEEALLMNAVPPAE